MTTSWIWKSIVASSCGSAAHYALMYFKARTGILPSFQPYESLQIALAELTGRDVHPLVPWALSFVNGMAVLGFIFGRIYRHIPGRNGTEKGFVFGVLGWMVMSLAFLPMIGLGPFATATGLNFWPGLFTLAMMLAYTLVMGQIYAMLNR